jgi:cyclohexanone monooxygenase
MQKSGYTRVEPTREAQEAWSEEVIALGNTTLFMRTPSWFTGGNIPGKKREILIYLGGLIAFAERCRRVAEKGFEGFVAR